MSQSLLAVRDLTVVPRAPGGRELVRSVNLEVHRGQCLGIVGESGSGKSLTLRAVQAVLPPSLRQRDGQVLVDGSPLPSFGKQARRSRRRRLSMVFQDSAAALNPLT
ncbi:MAG: ATP-binding cassette domain-containing protein, partial [Bifidobacteriaceae bacterium]|nr:ATP-binding cassette domain-containing protein [Bifidobacteriaceae bacterium]